MNSAKPVVAAGGVLYRELDQDLPEVALIYRKGVWDLPKGKQEEGESIISCAQREVAEELGIDLPVVVELLTPTWHTYKESGKSFLKTTYWYAMKPSAEISGFIPQAAEKIEDAEWVSLTEAKKRVGFDNLRKVLQAFEALYREIKKA